MPQAPRRRTCETACVKPGSCLRATGRTLCKADGGPSVSRISYRPGLRDDHGGGITLPGTAARAFEIDYSPSLTRRTLSAIYGTSADRPGKRDGAIDRSTSDGGEALRRARMPEFRDDAVGERPAFDRAPGRDRV